MTAREVELSGGAPWGFRMHGGADQNQPLKIARGPIGILTLTTGRPVKNEEFNTVNSELITNGFFIEQLSALTRERIPVRVVHGKGAGALGYLNVTHDVTSISNVAFLSKVGKITPAIARFSSGFSEKGSPDTQRGFGAIAAKFYTEEGNWDFTGLNTDTFFFKDPIFFVSGVRVAGRNPKTQLPDSNALFDLLTLRPESLNTALQFFGDIGVPASYRNMASFSIHTFQVENDRGQISWVRFKFTPDLGIKNLNQSETIRLSGARPDLYTEDLYNAVESGNFPTWTVGWQVLTKKDIKKAKFDVFDPTMRWPEEKYPVRPFAKFVVNGIPDDHFKDVEQLSFNPNNLVPGIQGMDTLFKARSWAYRDAAMHRLGPNMNRIKVNCPVNQVYTYTRDGPAPVRDTFGGMPNYYPNSFNGPVPALDTRTRTKPVKVYTDPGFTNARQIADYYKSLPKGPRQRLVENFSSSLALTYPSTQEKMLNVLGKIDRTLKRDMKEGLAKAKAAAASRSNEINYIN